MGRKVSVLKVLVFPSMGNSAASKAALQKAPVAVAVASALAAAALAAPAARAQITPTTGSKGLGSQVNGGTCSSGSCSITGGTGSGNNLFHRFDTFDTRSGITGVSIDPQGKGNVIMGVLAPGGTFLDTTVTLGSKANLFWLSPGGISITGGGGFRNVGNLSLSTSRALQVGSGTFDVFDTTSTELNALSGAPGSFLPPSGRAGDIVLSDGLLEVDGALLLDADSLTTRGRNTVSGPWTLSLDSWTNEGALVFNDGGSATFTRPTVWTNAPDGRIALGFDPARIVVNRGGSPFTGIPANGDAAVAPQAVVQGPEGGRVTLRNFGEIFKSTDSTQVLSRVDLRNLRSDTSFYPPPNDNIRKTDPVYTGRIEITAGTLRLDESSVFSENSGSVFLLFDSALEVSRAEPLVNDGFIGGMGTLRLGRSGDGTLENRGVVAPGLRGTVGELKIEGSLVQPRNASAAAIDVDLGDSQSDLLSVSRNVDLQGGGIEAYLLDGYTPREGDSFSVIKAGSGLSISPEVEEQLPQGIISVVDRDAYDLLAGVEFDLSEKQLFFLTRSRDDATLLGEQLSLLSVTLDQSSFSLGALSGPDGPLGTIGPTTILDPSETQQLFLQGEQEARVTTQNVLGLTETMGEGSLTPAEVQRLLRRAADEVRGDCRERGTC